MAKLILRQKAIDDLSNIWEYTAETWSEKQADKYYSMIKVACENIANDVIEGKVYENISSNLLGYKTGKHIIFYQYFSEDEIEVIRILHERMDIESRLKE
ncbi:MAG: type II toxin-antitoxin system RelE/ParE family toxin [Tenacibaculum sp.]|nr:type II toxin-antitoxin system RelE/ParE family toxin [Tenacibaculum sp.]